MNKKNKKRISSPITDLVMTEKKIKAEIIRSEIKTKIKAKIDQILTDEIEKVRKPKVEVKVAGPNFDIELSEV